MIERILVPGIMKPVSHYCHVVRAGPHVWVSGVVGMDGNGHVPEGVVEQFDLAINVMDQCLSAAIRIDLRAVGRAAVRQATRVPSARGRGGRESNPGGTHAGQVHSPSSP